ncbi:MAG: hypothetical protein ACLTKD_14455 [Blautia hansenii]
MAAHTNRQNHDIKFNVIKSISGNPHGAEWRQQLGNLFMPVAVLLMVSAHFS